MKMKKIRYIALALAAVFCVSLLTACSSSSDEEEDQTGEETSSLTGAEGEETAAAYWAGLVLSVDGEEVTLQRFAPADSAGTDTVSDPADFQPEDYALAQETQVVTLDDESVLYGLDGTDTVSATLGDVLPGSILLVSEDSDGVPTDVIIQNYSEAWQDSPAQVVSVGDDTLEVSWYQLESDSSGLKSYLDTDLTGAVLDGTTESLTVSENTAVYQVQDGMLAEAALEDLAGQDVLVSVSSAGEVLRVIQLNSGSDTALES